MSGPIQELVSYIERGGWMMYPLIALGLILFTSLFRALLLQWTGIETTEAGATFDRRLRYLKVLTSVAPLMGLLGTVAGMLKTFRGLSDSGLSVTENMVAVGISEALITTQTGLSIGVIGLTGIMWYRQSNHKYLLYEYKAAAVRLRSLHEGGER